MSATRSGEDANRIGKLILVPAVITLAVTLLRLVGELQGWSPTLFARECIFCGALVGIWWLVPVFGAWFGWKLTRAGSGPGSLGRAFGLTLASLAVMPLFSFLAPKVGILPERLPAAGPKMKRSSDRAALTLRPRTASARAIRA